MKKINNVLLLIAILSTLLGVPSTKVAKAAPPADVFSMRFYGHGTSQIDRIKIPIDPQVPADVGGDFTFEFWMKAASANNTSGTCTSGGNNWINGNIVIDRDVFGAGDNGDYGISLYGGKIAFGVGNSSTDQTLCSTTSVADNTWHHIAVTRNQTSGQMRIFVDGVLDATGTGPTGDISYRNGRATSYPDSDPYLVFGAEKHDAGSSYPSYNGFLDEVRISNNVRYTANFSRPIAPMPLDANTVALYRFDEGPAGNCTGGIVDSDGAASNGACSFGGSAPAGPVYSASDLPPIYQPDLVITGYQLRNAANNAVITRPNPNETFIIRMTVENRGGGDSGTFYPGVFLDDKPNFGPDHSDPPLVLGEVTSFQDYRITPAGSQFGEGCLYYDPAGTINPFTTDVQPERGNYTRPDYNNSLPAGSSTTVDVTIAYPASDPSYLDPVYDNIRTGLEAGSYQIYLYADPNCSGGEVEASETNNAFGPIQVITQTVPLETPWVGGITVEANRNVVAVGRPHIDTEVMTYNGFINGSTTMYVPMLFKNMWTGYNAALYVQNLDAANTANLTFSYYDVNGNLVCSKNDTLNARSSKGYWIPAETCLPASWYGAVVVTSNRNIVAVGRPHIDGQITTYNGFASGGTTMYVPMLFKDSFGGDYDSALYIQNITQNPAAVTINFYDNTGQLSCTKQDTISRLSSKGYWLPTVTCDSGALPTGWVGGVVVTSNQNIVAVGRPHIGAQVTTYSGFSSGGLKMHVPMLFKSAFGSYDSALYVQNIGASPASITINYYDTNGQLSCTKQDTLASLASKGYWIPSVICDTGALPVGWSGSAIVTSSTQNIIAVGRPHLGAEIMTYNGFVSGSLSNYVPMLFNNAFGGSYDSAFYLQNLDVSNTATVLVKFYDSMGNLSCTREDTIAPLASRGYWLPGLNCFPP